MKKILWMVVVLGLTAAGASADTIVLKNGETIDGVIVRQGKKWVRIKHFVGAGMITTKYALDEIESLVIDDEANRDFLNRYRSEVRAFEEETESEENNLTEEQRIERLLRKWDMEEQRWEQDQEEAEEKAEARLKRDRRAKAHEAAVWEEKKLEKDFDREMERERESLRFGFIKESVNRDGRRAYEGEVYNDGKNAKKNVVIRMDFYDNKGDYLTTGRVNSDPGDIAPGGKASFKIFVFNPGLKIITYEKFALWDYREE